MVDKMKMNGRSTHSTNVCFLYIVAILLFVPVAVHAGGRQYTAEKVPLPSVHELYREQLYDDGAITGAFPIPGTDSKPLYYYQSPDGAFKTFEVSDVNRNAAITASPTGHYAFLRFETPLEDHNSPISYRLLTFLKDKSDGNFVLEEVVPELQMHRHFITELTYDQSDNLILSGYMHLDEYFSAIPFVIRKIGEEFTYDRYVQMTGMYFLGVDNLGVALIAQPLNPIKHLFHVGRIGSATLPLQPLDGLPYEVLHREYPYMISANGAIITQTKKYNRNVDSLFVRESGSKKYKELFIKRKVARKNSNNRTKTGVLTISAVNDTHMVGRLGKIGPVVVDIKKRNTLRGRGPLARLTENFPENCSMSSASDINQFGEILIKAYCTEGDDFSLSLFRLSPK